MREAQRRATEAVRPGVSGEELNRIAASYLAEQGYATRLGRDGGAPLEEGFIHYLGHGLGLDLHEAPTLDEGGETLVVGDVVTIEPGLYRPGWGGCRIEDVVVVTEDGYELLTDCPYDLVVQVLRSGASRSLATSSSASAASAALAPCGHGASLLRRSAQGSLTPS